MRCRKRSPFSLAVHHTINNSSRPYSREATLKKSFEITQAKGNKRIPYKSKLVTILLFM